VAILNPVNSSVEVTPEEEIVTVSEGSRRLVEQEDYDSAVFENLTPYIVKPLGTAKIQINLTNLDNKFLYNKHFSIVILDEEKMVQELPDYFKNSDSGEFERNIRTTLEIRIFNPRDVDITFYIGFYLFHGLFKPYL